MMPRNGRRSTTRSRGLRGLAGLVALVALVAGLPSLFADDAPRQAPPPVEESLFGDEYLSQRGAATCVASGFGAGGPLRQASVLAVGTQLHLWDPPPPSLQGEDLAPVGAGLVVLAGTTGGSPLNQFAFLKAGEHVGAWSLPFNAHKRPLSWHIQAVRDNTPLLLAPSSNVESIHEVLALNDAVLKSLRTPLATLQRAAISALTLDDLTNAPARYRTQVLLIEGRVKRVRQLDAPASLASYGIKHLYQVWLVNQLTGVPHLFCLLSPVLPPGLAVADNVTEGPNVAAVGYFFKNIRFTAKEGVGGAGDPAAPMLVGYGVPVITQQERTGAAAGAVLLSGFPAGGGPFRQVALLDAGERAGCWVLRDPAHVPPLNRSYFWAVRDGKPMPTVGDDDTQTEEAFVYYDAVRKAHDTPPELFVKDARPDVTFAHLFQESWRYRGEVVAIKGHLRRVRRFEPEAMVKSKTLKDLYECWLYNDEYGTENPACLWCTKLPPGIKVTESVKGDVRVTFVGYFYKRLRYKAPDTKKPNEFRDAPVLIGHIVVEPRQEQQTQTAWTGGLLPIFFGIVIVTLALVVGLGWAFRRSDQRVRARLDAASEQFLRSPEE